ncbi:MAG: sulfatase-like hydrolase/transferase [Candidatus Dadabacteria bacterium]
MPILILLLLFSAPLFAQNKPDIIYIMADDMGYADLSCYGQKHYSTPQMDHLAGEGVKFMNAYAAAPVCTPTRVAFYTGRYPARAEVGLYEPIAEGKKDSSVGLPLSVPTIATILDKAGYNTYLVGKWHLGYTKELSPVQHGFDYFFGFHAGAMDYISHSNDLYENETAINKEGYATDLFADKAIELIQQPHSKPYFLALMFSAPHWPWQAPGSEPYPKGFQNWTKGGSPQIYAAIMKNLDDAVGRIVKAVDESKKANNTVIIFTSDNGGERYSDNHPYKGGKMELWEGGIREPAFIRWPGKIKPHSISNQVVTTMDWTASIISLAGTKPDINYPLDGENILPIVMGQEKEKERTLFWRVYQRKQQKAVRQGNLKYLNDKDSAEYLFDLRKDPTENRNLATKQPQVVQQLKTQMAAWEKQMLKPIPLAARNQKE